jgi:hypothetical protein
MIASVCYTDMLLAMFVISPFNLHTESRTLMRTIMKWQPPWPSISYSYGSISHSWDDEVSSTYLLTSPAIPERKEITAIYVVNQIVVVPTQQPCPKSKRDPCASLYLPSMHEDRAATHFATNHSLTASQLTNHARCLWLSLFSPFLCLCGRLGSIIHVKRRRSSINCQRFIAL